MMNCGTRRVFLAKRALPYIGLVVHVYVKCLELTQQDRHSFFLALIELFLILLVRKAYILLLDLKTHSTFVCPVSRKRRPVFSHVKR